MNAPQLTGGRCQCTACGEYFTSDRTFDKHRVGQFGSDRRCLAVAEMVAGGWVKNARGFWTNVAPQPAHIDVAAPRSILAMQSPCLTHATPETHALAGAP